MSKSIEIEKTAAVFEPKVLVFACNWCSYAGADNAGVSRIQYSANVRLLRVMCSGRVHPSFVLKAFAEGSDGVIVSGCHFGDCHYMFGNYKAEEQFDRLKEIVRILGLEPERIALEWISAAEGPRFAQVINNFVENIREIGPSPLSNGVRKTSTEKYTIDLKKYRVNECLECGRCTGICPVSKATLTYSPRRLLSRGIAGGIEYLSSDPAVWACLTCKQCEKVCPSDIPYSELNEDARVIAGKLGVENSCSHGGVFEQITELMTREHIKQDRLSWITDDLQIDPESDTIFYSGCSPYFAAYFGDQYSDVLLGSLRSSVRLLNKIGIKPRILSNEICCGNDLLLRGEKEKFEGVAKIVTRQIKETGASRIVFSCPECLVTFREKYPKFGAGTGLEFKHISELVGPNINTLKLKKTDTKITYQDPCRLGRYSKIYDEPREILKAASSNGLNEMRHNRDNATCCGNTAWISCNAGTKELQKSRLKEAFETHADTLITACPKCFIHLTCSEKNGNEFEGSSIKINDIWNYIGTHLYS